MFCKGCNTKMRYVLRFEKGAMFEFERCPKCYAESKKVPYTVKTKTEQVNYKTERSSPRKRNNGG